MLASMFSCDPQIPEEAPEMYRQLRRIRAMHLQMQREGGAHFGNPLLFGLDPFFDRCDFQMEDREDGAISARYVGDCAAGGYRSRHEY